MAATTRVNGSVGAHGTLFSVMQLKAFVIDAGSSLAAATGVDGALEQLIREVQPLMEQSSFPYRRERQLVPEFQVREH